MINIAIDGPAGAGKSTIAKMVAASLGYIYVDTGALYRAVGMYVLKKGQKTDDIKAVSEALNEIHAELKFENGTQYVYVNGEDYSEIIRLPEASMAASNVSKMPAVRAFLFDLQKRLAAEHNCIMDGRDIGTVVLPEAQVKIFLTALAEVRAKRRFDELAQRGTPVDYNELLTEIRKRDEQDEKRPIAPLKPAKDAVILDSSYLNIQQVTERIIGIVKEAVQ